VSHYSALAALDWGLKAARAADDGGQWGRRRSGEGSSSGRGNAMVWRCSGE
jgi:hypothetical protein